MRLSIMLSLGEKAAGPNEIRFCRSALRGSGSLKIVSSIQVMDSWHARNKEKLAAYKREYYKSHP